MSRLAICFCILSSLWTATANAKCVGKFFNPITDICWSCVFPIKLAGATVIAAGQEDTNTGNGTSPICACTNPVRIGLSTSFWEPARMVDVTRTPYCFVALGGVEMDFGYTAGEHAQTAHKEARPGHAFYQAHWYVAPILFWLEVLLDNTCLENGVLDVAYITEMDPMWDDSELNFIINPDVALFGNMAAQAACALDCVTASVGFPLDELYWCGGCQGSLFPMNGWVTARGGAVAMSSLVTQRLAAKMHRELLVWAASGEDGQCQYYPQPVMQKSNYKYSMIYPIPQTKKILGRCCQPFGRTTTLWGGGREYPMNGEDFSYLLYRKRDCCAGNLLNYLN